MGSPLHRRVVPESYVQLLYEYLDAHGHAPESILGAPWPTPAPHGLGGIDVEIWEQMLEQAAAQLANPLLSLHVGQAITAQHLGILGTVLSACENLGAALQRLERYQRLIFDVVPMRHRIGDGWIDLIWDISQYRPGRLVEETGYSVLLQFARVLTRSPLKPLAVRFAHGAAGDVRTYEEHFGCPVLFAHPEPGLRCSLDFLATPLRSPDPGLIALLERHADTLLARLPQQAEFVEKLRKSIIDSLREGTPDIETISAKLFCSSRTLQRRLRRVGTGFRSELNLVRHELAVSYLRDPRLQIAEIAMLLGDSEHSAFTRAFRERTRETPLETRLRWQRDAQDPQTAPHTAPPSPPRPTEKSEAHETL